MKFALITLAVLCLVALIAWWPSRPEPRLQGTWRSNKEETVAVWRREGVIRDKIIDQFEKDVLGKLSVTYAGRRTTSTMGDWTEVEKYRVVESGEDFVVFDRFSTVQKQKLRWRVRFVKDGYWISSDELLKGYTEKFDRVARGE